MRRLKLVIETEHSSSDIVKVLAELNLQYLEMTEEKRTASTNKVRDYKAEHARRRDAEARRKDAERHRETRALKKATQAGIPNVVAVNYPKLTEKAVTKRTDGGHKKEDLVLAPYNALNYYQPIDIDASLKKLGLTREDLMSRPWPVQSAENAIKLSIRRQERSKA